MLSVKVFTVVILTHEVHSTNCLLFNLIHLLSKTVSLEIKYFLEWIYKYVLTV